MKRLVWGLWGGAVLYAWFEADPLALCLLVIVGVGMGALVVTDQ